MKHVHVLTVLFVSVFAGVLRSAPIVPGFTVQPYASVPDPVRLTFDPSGVLYTGADPGESRAPDRIYRIGIGGTPVTKYGIDAIADPDAVLFDGSGIISGTPGSVLVGGDRGGSGYIAAIRPDQSVVTIFAGGFRNPTDMMFTPSGSMIFADFDLNSVFITNGSNLATLFSLPVGGRVLDIDPVTGNIFTGCTDGTIRVHTLSGVLVNGSYLSGLAGAHSFAFGRGGVWGNDLYVLTGPDLYRYDRDRNRTLIGTGFSATTWDIAFGPDNALYVSDDGNGTIWRIVPEPASGMAALFGLALLCTRRRGASQWRS